MHRLSLTNRLISALVSRLWRMRRLRGRRFLVDRLLPFVQAMPSYYGPVLRVRPGDFTNRAAIFGSYGDEVADWVRRLQPDDVFLDIGANTGLFSLIADHRVTQGQIFAFEPNTALFDDLRYNLAVNGARRVSPLNVALSDRTCTSTLSYDPRHTGGASLSHDGGEAASENSVRREDVVVALAPSHLDAVIEATRHRRVCIKIDVEGHELNVLKGLRDAGLLARAAWVIAEIDPGHLCRFGASVNAVYELMDDAGLTPTKRPGLSGHYDEIFVRNEAADAHSPTSSLDKLGMRKLSTRVSEIE